MNEYRRTPDSEKCFFLFFSLFLQILEYARNRKCPYTMGKVRAVLCGVVYDAITTKKANDDEKTQHT